MRTLALFLVLVASLGLLSLAGETRASAGLSLSAPAHSPLARPGEEVSYDVRLSAPADLAGQPVTLAATLPPGFTYRAGSTLVNGRPAADPAVSGSALQWAGLPAPSDRPPVYGVHTLVQDIMDPPHTAAHLDWARALAGPGGYVKQLLYPITASTQGPQSSWVDFVSGTYTRDLIPVLRLQGVYNPQAGRWEKPQPDPDGSYTSIAAAFQRVVAQLPRREGKPLYIEVWNEPNLDVEWSGSGNPAEYARFLVAVSQALRALGDPRIVILNGGLAPGGNILHLDFIDAMFQAVPAAAQAFDVWASHPYAGNHPPAYNETYYSVHGYRWELDRLARYRDVANLKVMITEAGYALGNRDDPRYPAIDESNRAAYTREAFERYWSTDGTLLGVMPFELSDPFGSWAGFDWVYPAATTRADGTPSQAHAVYEAVQTTLRPAPELTVTFRLAVPSAEGTFRPFFQASSGAATVVAGGEAVTVTALQQAGVVSGQVFLQARAGGAGATVTIGSYSATTAADGSYQLAVPPGTHTVSVAAGSYLGSRREEVVVVANARTTLPTVKLLAGNVVAEPPGSGTAEQVDIRDLAAIAVAYNSTPPSNPAADLNGDGTVNVYDLVAATGNLGRLGPIQWN